jgi:hypothetical protein
MGPETKHGYDGDGQQQFYQTDREQLSDCKFIDTILFHGVSKILSDSYDFLLML